jgi:glycosyltransferase involved in cell wall biosynthesis
MKHVAIGIITYHRPEGLKRALESVAAQALGGKGWMPRVIVVDNGAEAPEDSPTHALMRRMKDFPFPLAYVHEPRRGLSHARNAVVAALKDEEALLFLDDDEEATPTWLSAMLAYAEGHPETGILVGPVSRHFPDKPSLSWTASSWYFSAAKRTTGEKVRFGHTGNMLLSRKVWQTLRPVFDPDYNLSGGEDLKLSLDANRKGLGIHWVAEALVIEHVGAERATLGWLLRRGLRVGSVRGYAHRKEALSGEYGRAGENLVSGVRLMLRSLLKRNKANRYDGFYFFWIGVGSLLGRTFGYRYQEYKDR